MTVKSNGEHLRKITILGAKGLIGREMTNFFHSSSEYLVTPTYRGDANLLDPIETFNLLRSTDPDIVLCCAGKVGGVGFNRLHGKELLEINSRISLNIFSAAEKLGIKNLINFGSSCMYPKSVEYNLKPSDLMSGPLEESSAPYAMAKLLAVYSLRETRNMGFLNWNTIIPSNLYGFSYSETDLLRSHVIQALIMKIKRGAVLKEKELFFSGSGSALRQFLSVGDLAKAVDLVLRQNSLEFAEYNVASNNEISISNVASILADLIGFKGEIFFLEDKDFSGVRRKHMNSDAIRELGWFESSDLRDGLSKLI